MNSLKENKTGLGEVASQKRRSLLKWVALGSGAFVLGKIFGDLFSEKVIRDVDFQNFRFIETNKNLTIYERGGEEILVVDKDSF